MYAEERVHILNRGGTYTGGLVEKLDVKKLASGKLKVVGQGPYFSNLYIKSLLGLSNYNKAWRERSTSVLKTDAHQTAKVQMSE